MMNEVKMLFVEDRGIMVNDIAFELGISEGSAHAIPTKDLKIKKRSARWVPYILSEEQQANHLMTCQNHLKRYRREGDQFLNRIKQMSHLQKQNDKWRSANSPSYCRQGNLWTGKIEKHLHCLPQQQEGPSDLRGFSKKLVYCYWRAL